jgi:hypothetical protein
MHCGGSYNYRLSRVGATNSLCNFMLRLMFRFYVYHSVHRESIPKKFKQDDTLVKYFINSCKSLYMFRVKVTHHQELD